MGVAGSVTESRNHKGVVRRPRKRQGAWGDSDAADAPGPGEEVGAGLVPIKA